MKNYLEIFLVLCLLLSCWSCTDKPEKIMEAASVIRIEPSDCTTCKRCVNDFKCPREAISIINDKAVIDLEECVSCKLCINEFKCPYSAIKDYPDNIAPSTPANFRTEDSSATTVTISFDDSYDDYNSTKGFASKYSVRVDTLPNIAFANAHEIYAGKDPFQFEPIPNLFPNKTYYFQVIAYDEAGNSSGIAKLKAHTLAKKGGK